MIDSSDQAQTDPHENPIKNRSVARRSKAQERQEVTWKRRITRVSLLGLLNEETNDWFQTKNLR